MTNLNITTSKNTKTYCFKVLLADLTPLDHVCVYQQPLVWWKPLTCFWVNKFFLYKFQHRSEQSTDYDTGTLHKIENASVLDTSQTKYCHRRQTISRIERVDWVTVFGK